MNDFDDNPLKIKSSPKPLRWTPRIKKAILAEIDEDPSKILQILIQHEISLEELAEWRKYFAKDGLKALRTTKLHTYRPTKRLKLSPRRIPNL